jgi:hypothetical protein
MYGMAKKLEFSQVKPDKIFSSVFEQKPDLIVFDYDFLEQNIVNILRRIRTNTFYDSIKICCYKTKPHTRTDDLLRTLGVNYMVYAQDISAERSSRNKMPVIPELSRFSLFGFAFS